MIEQLDKSIFLVLNGLHNPFFDVFFYNVSGRLIWVPLYLIILYLLIINFRKKSIPIIIFAFLLIVITDQLSVHLFKNIFLRLRPCHDPQLAGLVHTVNDSCGGLYGFISSHAANTFAFATFIAFILRKDYKYLPAILLFWAVIVSYSRIYLGAHFPGDVLVGAIFGMLTGTGIYFLHKKLSPLIFGRLNFRE